MKTLDKNGLTFLLSKIKNKLDKKLEQNSDISTCSVDIKGQSCKIGKYLTDLSKSDIGLSMVENIKVMAITESNFNSLSPTEKNRPDVFYFIQK